MSAIKSTSQPRSILLVGGGDGIGLETTLHLLLNSPSTIQLIVFGLHINGDLHQYVRAHGRLHLLQGDVTKPADREKAIQLCLKAAGSLDCMVYCAGLITPIQRIEKADLNAVRLAYEVNVFGVIAMVGTLSTAFLSTIGNKEPKLSLLSVNSRFRTCSAPHDHMWSSSPRLVTRR